MSSTRLSTSRGSNMVKVLTFMKTQKRDGEDYVVLMRCFSYFMIWSCCGRVQNEQNDQIQNSRGPNGVYISFSLAALKMEDTTVGL